MAAPLMTRTFHYGRRSIRKPAPSIEELARARDVKYICPLDGNQYTLNDQPGPTAICPRCGRELQKREVM